MDPANIGLIITGAFSLLTLIVTIWSKSTLDKVHTEVNSRLTAALDEIKKLRGERATEVKDAAVSAATAAGVAAGAAAVKGNPQ